MTPTIKHIRLWLRRGSVCRGRSANETAPNLGGPPQASPRSPTMRGGMSVVAGRQLQLGAHTDGG
jgi:hypothetical protein